MIYEVLLANGEELITKVVKGVCGIGSEDNSYRLFDSRGKTLFIAPQDSVVYVSLA